jgi:predicted transcriptional regulator
MRLNIMHDFYSKHNANLPQTLPEQASIVNPIDIVEVSSASLDVSLAVTTTDKLFVKIPNKIYEYLLKPRLLEFYCLISYLVFNYPSVELPILTIQSLILKHTGYLMSKNTINKYLNNLIDLGLIKREHKYYIITDLSGDKGIPLDKRVDCSEQDGSWSNVLYRMSNTTSLDTSDLTNSRPFCPPSYQEGFNVITLPKDNYTPFYITQYIKKPNSGSLALELYLASKPYTKHRPSKVCRDLNISRKTYYTYLQDIISKQMVKRIKLSCNNYHYTHDYRLVLWAESSDRMKNQYEQNKAQWELKKQKRLNSRSSNCKRWYASPMLRVMKQYGMNYIKGFEGYSPDDAYAIVVELEKQYKSFHRPLTAALIVKGILRAYNWTKIVDKRHEELKASMFKVKNNVFDSMFRVDYS